MKHDMDTRVLDLFSRAAELPPDERGPFLDRMCDGDSVMLVQVKRLLAWDERADDFLEQQPFYSPVTEMAGDVLGPYTLIRQIGEGGMAFVWIARQEEPVHRDVAVKILKPGMDTSTVLARFELERQLLAHLSHPNIASVLDAGTTELGRPYFVMEYVDGTALTTFCNTQGLDITTRLELFCRVCDVVHFAHLKSVIHRDIKPSNILVGLRGDVAIPNVIDFGIAKATAGELTSGADFTEHGQLMGTPEYMSPEQCRADSNAIDVRTDVYSLGVVLYEMLCGRVPYDLDGVPLFEVPRVICEQTVIRPSTLNKRLHGDLDTILLKSMEKRPEDRYQSAADLARDVRRYLECQPIEARQRSVMYRVRMFSKRHSVFVGASVAMLLTLIGAVIVSLVFAAEAGRERDTAVYGEYVASMSAAEAAYRSQQFQRLQTRLDRAPEALRGWEWSFLKARSDSSMRVLSHDALIDAMCVSDDGTRLVTGDGDGVVRVWDSISGEPLLTIQAEGRVFGVDMTRDGSRIGVGASDGSVRIYDSVTGELLQSHKGPDVAYGVRFLDDGERLLAAVGHTLRMLDAATLEQVWEVPHRYLLYSICVDPDETSVVSATEVGVIRFLDIESGEIISSFRAHDRAILNVEFHPDGDRLLSCAQDGLLRVWDRRHEMIGETSAGPGFARYSPDGSIIVIGRPNPSFVIDVLDAESLEPLGWLAGHADTVDQLAFSPDGLRLYSGSWDQTARIWDMHGDLDPTMLEAEGSIWNLAFSPDGRLVASTSGTEQVVLRDAASLDVVTSLAREDWRAWVVDFDPERPRFAVGWTSGVIDVRDSRTGEILFEVQADDKLVTSLALSPDGTRLAAGTIDREVHVWDLERRELLHTLTGHVDSIGAVAFSDDRVAASSGSAAAGLVTLWDAETGAMIREIHDHTSRVYDISFTPDGAWLVSGSRDQTVRFWDAATGEPGEVLEGHGQFITSLAFSPDGDRLVAGSYFQTLTMWDRRGPEPLINVEAHDGLVRAIAYHPSGTWFLTGANDHTIRLWDVRSRDEIAEDRRRARARLAGATGEVQSMLARLGTPEAVVGAIEGDGALDEPTRQALLNAVLALSGAAP